ncbi:hypothetical protein D8674_034089 [Pyrus ussuriensis x Pyrus communis]|uniref:PB1 domain-containing protein n=1 Tax=Pyrus ussuriensis x Pyrus communis TaxID=2448454 RepID=A0A5N5I0X1_9ROSA|nr:hypothetical protein D8674_034089 [Pyrus ussuriensis x Pyrus communis]
MKYQLPNEDLNSMISVTTDEDVDNMMEEYNRIAQNQNSKLAWLYLFLFIKGSDNSINSSDTHDQLVQTVIELRLQNKFLKSQFEGF